MSRIALYLLGPPRLERDEQPLQVRRRKVTALLAYVTVTGQSHSRETLVTLLSPELSQSRARAEFRRTLSVLNSLLGEGYVMADREMVRLNADAVPRLGLDVDRFRQLLADRGTHDHPPDQVCPDCLPLLSEAVALYRDDFMAGFNLPDSLAFEEWQFFEAERLRSELASALCRLVRWHSARGEGEYEHAIAYARRWLALDALHEPAHRQLMRLYAQSGQHTAALRQYRSCLRVLEEELDILPAAETTALYQQIRAERQVSAPTPAPLPARPAFLSQEEAPAAAGRDIFVARERELVQLNRRLDAALTGQGQVVFITGGPGRGKTALLTEFARRAMEMHPDLLVAVGHCNAYSGLGDPYLPFRKALGMLTGDVEAQWAAGAITREHTLRLKAALPVAVGALLEHGAPLIDIFVPGTALLSRAAAAAPEGAAWLGRLKAVVEGEKAEPGELAQSQLFERYTELLRALAARQPLLLVLDDLQWADSGSTGLLFHLGRELRASRILIAGAYRPEEVALGRPSTSSGQRERHPLDKVLAEFERVFGELRLDLRQADELEGRRFVDAFLDTEPNRLGEAFRAALFQHTAGHPLFTIELLHAMQERGDLIQDADADGAWVAGATLDWGTLPARVEAVIAERVGRLEDPLRDLLSIASVEGEEFTAQVVARVGGMGEREALRALSRELGTRHRLVRELGELRVNDRFLSRYRFAHALFQVYLTHTLSAGERRLLHGEIAEALEGLHEGETESITAGLAHHYAEAGRGEKAVAYLLLAGDKARLAYAHEEAIGHFERALGFLRELGVHEKAARTLMKLGLTHHNAFQFRRAQQAYDEGFALWQRAAATPPTTPPPHVPHALRAWLRGCEILDPTMAKDDFSCGIIVQLFSGLVELTPEMEAIPDVARSWEVSAGGRQYVFHLRDDVYWSDGVPVTAGDFEFAWKRALDPSIGAPLANLLHDIKGTRVFRHGEGFDPDRIGVRALDAVTLMVELDRPAGYFLLLLTQAVTFPVPRHVVEAHGEAWTEVENIVTSGPFRLETWQRGESSVLVRNPEYHGRFTGNLQRVELFSHTDLSAGLEMYEADGLDVLAITVLPPAEVDGARQRHAGEYAVVPQLRTNYLGFDVSRPPFDDVRVRRAIILATDRETFADAVLGGHPFPATGGFVPPGMPGHSAGIGLPYDALQARQLLAEAGYPDGRGFPTVGVLAPLYPITHMFKDYIVAQWRENLGVNILWEEVDLATYLDRIDIASPRMYQAFHTADYPDPDNFLRASRFRTRSRWQNKAYDELVEQARYVTDQEGRMELYQRADSILIQEAPIMPCLYTRRHLLVKPWVRAYPISPLAEPQWKDVIIEPH